MEADNYTAGEEYPDLENHNSHMAHCLTEEVYKKMRAVETTTGFTIDKVIQVGVDNPGDAYSMDIGCVAGDEESYDVFGEFFDSIIEARHGGYKKCDLQKWNGDCEQIIGDCLHSFVLSCRVRGIRNIKGICLPSHCTRAERRKVEMTAKGACLKLSGDYKGKYLKLQELSEEQCQEVLGGLSSKSPASGQLFSGISRDWPDARGVFFNDKKSFVVKTNVKDHLQIVSNRPDGDVKQAFAFWNRGAQELDKLVCEQGREFMQTPHLGYLATCPSNLGTTLKVTVRISLERMSKHPRIEEVIRRLHLEKRSLDTNPTALDVSNYHRLGLSEVEIVQSLIESVQFLIKCEEKLIRNESIEIDINRIKQK